MRQLNPSAKDESESTPPSDHMKTCKFCRRQVSSSHYCTESHRTIPYDDGSSFTTSMLYGMALHNGPLGGVLGGNMAGGMVGEMLSPSSSAPDYSSPAPDYSPPPDTSSSTDSGYSGTDTSASSGGGGDF